MAGETIPILRATLARRRRSQRLLELQAADYPPGHAPLHILNQLDGIERAIGELERELRARGDDPATVSDDDLPPAEPPPGEPPGALRPVPQMAPRLDAHIGRPAELEAIKAALLAADGNAPASGDPSPGAVVAIRGAGGFGKTTLAAMACRDPEIQSAFPGGVLWATLGEQPDPLAAFGVLVRGLSAAEPRFINLEDAAAQLARGLAGRRCLLVLDDVWQAASLAPFLRVAAPAAWLITTRMLDIAPDARSIAVDGMAEAEAAALLAMRLPAPAPDPAPLLALARRLGAWPLLLNLAGAYLAEQVGVFGRPLAQALAALEARYERAGIAAFNQRDAQARNAAADRSLAVSLELLDDESRRCFAELAAFPEDAAIPLALAARLWGLDPLGAEDLAQHFARLSLARLDLAGETLLLHDVVRAYLARRLGAALPAVHRRLLDAHRAGGELLLAANDSYLWDRVFWHLREAGLLDELLARAADLRLLARRIARDGVGAALGDVRLARQAAPADPICAILARELALLPQLFAPLADWRDCGHALLTRLGHEPALAESSSQLLAALPPPWILPSHPPPDRPDPALRAVLPGHSGVVHCCALSADGAVAVSGGADGTLRIWDVGTGLARHILAAQTDEVTSCAISADGRIVATGGADGPLRIWDARTGAIRQVLSRHSGAVLGCALSANGAIALSVGKDGTAQIWDTRTGAIRYILTGQAVPLNACALSADGTTAVLGGDDGIVQVWNIASGQHLQFLKGDDGMGQVWDIASGQHFHPRAGHGTAVRGCAITDDGLTAAMVFGQGSVQVWDVGSGALRWEAARSDHAVLGCALSADGAILATAGQDHALWLWEAATGRLLRTFTGHSSWVRACALSADGATVVSGADDHSVRVWDVDLSQSQDARSQPTRIRGCALSADGALGVSAGQNGRVQVWEAATGTPGLSFAGHGGSVQGCAIAADAAIVASAGADRKVHLRAVSSGRSLMVLDGHGDWVRGCSLSSDGAIVVSTGDDGTVRLWDGRDGRALHVLSGHKRDVHACAVSADGGLVVSAGSDGTARLWDGRAGRELHVLKGHKKDVRCCAVSADGGLVVSGGDDGTVRLWDGRDGRELRVLRGHRGRVYGCAASADGGLVVSAGGDGMLWLWDAAAGAPLRLWLADDRLSCCAMSADGARILAGGTKGLYWLAVWRTADEALAALERYRAGGGG